VIPFLLAARAARRASDAAADAAILAKKTNADGSLELITEAEQHLRRPREFLAAKRGAR
jgi:hypothetical protein